MKTFSQEAKRYGVLYCALANKKNSKIDGMVDIMVREEDASRINRIAERFNLRDVASIQKELDKEKQDKIIVQEDLEISKSAKEQFIDDIMPKEDKEEKEIPSNDTKETEKENLSEISSNIKSEDKMENSSNIEKKSVKEELKEIEQEINAKEESLEKKELQTANVQVKSKDKQKGGRRYKEKEEKHKAKHYKEPKHLYDSRKVKIKKKERSK